MGKGGPSRWEGGCQVIIRKPRLLSIVSNVFGVPRSLHAKRLFREKVGATEYYMLRPSPTPYVFSGS